MLRVELLVVLLVWSMLVLGLCESWYCAGWRCGFVSVLVLSLYESALWFEILVFCIRELGFSCILVR